MSAALLLLLALVAGSGCASPPETGAQRLALRVAATGEPALERSAQHALARPEASARWAAFGDALMQRQRETEQPGDLASAETAYREALRLAPGSAAALVGLAWVHGVEHEFEASLAFAERALASDPGDPRAHGLLADAALELGDFARAELHVQAMLDRQPGLASYGRAALLLDRLGRYTEARQLMRRAIAAGGMAEHVAWCRAQLAQMLWRQGALVAAEQVLEEALAQAPDDTDVLRTAGILRAARGEHAAAIAAYERVAERAPHAEVLATLGDLYAAAGRDDLARSGYDRAEAAFAAPERHGGHAPGGDLARARFLADHDRALDVALREAEAAYRARPTPRAADTLAWVFHKLGRHEDAARFVRFALDAGARDAEVLYHAGRIEAARGRPAQARQYLYEALSRNPTFHPLYAAAAERQLVELGAQASR